MLYAGETPAGNSLSVINIIENCLQSWSHLTPNKFLRKPPVSQSVQSLSCVQLFVIAWIAARQASLSITNSWSSRKLMSIESVMPSSHLILCCPLLLLPQIPPSIRVFSNESTLGMKWPKYWSSSFSVIPSKEHPGLISFKWTSCPISLQEVVKSTCPSRFCFLVALIWPLSKASFDYTYLWSVMSAKIWVWKDKRMLFFLYLLWSLTQNSMNSSLIWEVG